MIMKWKEFFEKTKNNADVRKIVTDCFISSIATAELWQKTYPEKPLPADIGVTALSVLETMIKNFWDIDIELTDVQEIDARYISQLIEGYHQTTQKPYYPTAEDMKKLSTLKIGQIS